MYRANYYSKGSTHNYDACGNCRAILLDEKGYLVAPTFLSFTASPNYTCDECGNTDENVTAENAAKYAHIPTLRRR